jgi:hypothetical protein
VSIRWIVALWGANFFRYTDLRARLLMATTCVGAYSFEELPVSVRLSVDAIRPYAEVSEFLGYYRAKYF